MGFGRNRGANGPLVEPLAWEDVSWFVVTDIERAASFPRKPVKGRLAVRVPTAVAGVRHFAPAAYVVGGGEDGGPHELYEAQGAQGLVCTVTAAGDGHVVTDAEGAELGHVHRTPAVKRTVRHGLWLRQPGRPDAVARYHWAKGSAKDIATRGKDGAGRGAGALVGSVVDSVLSLGAEGGDRSGTRTAKPVTWRAGEETVLTQGYVDGVKSYVPQAGWLDRRLAFALAVLGR
ncbi:hypothetical protein ACFCWG_17210 [Streptomyces sp. NPDC056390]|uniref:hypothetical protein n=1 Tax=Streptomyces sp. NPDC056390 TaxID=3345806 RepID=UPI0035DB2FB0